MYYPLAFVLLCVLLVQGEPEKYSQTEYRQIVEISDSIYGFCLDVSLFPTFLEKTNVSATFSFEEPVRRAEISWNKNRETTVDFISETVFSTLSIDLYEGGTTKAEWSVEQLHSGKFFGFLQAKQKLISVSFYMESIKFFEVADEHMCAEYILPYLASSEIYGGQYSSSTQHETSILDNHSPENVPTKGSKFYSSSSVILSDPHSEGVDATSSDSIITTYLSFDTYVFVIGCVVSCPVIVFVLFCLYRIRRKSDETLLVMYVKPDQVTPGSDISEIMDIEMDTYLEPVLASPSPGERFAALDPTNLSHPMRLFNFRSLLRFSSFGKNNKPDEQEESNNTITDE